MQELVIGAVEYTIWPEGCHTALVSAYSRELRNIVKDSDSRDTAKSEGKTTALGQLHSALRLFIEQRESRLHSATPYEP